MNERKILLFILSVIFYCFYSVHMWFTKYQEKPKIENQVTKPEIALEIPDVIAKVTNNVAPKHIPLYFENGCSILETFTVKPLVKFKEKKIENMDSGNNTITVIGITVFLVILAINAVLDVIKVKEEERARRLLNPNEERRQSLAEFANKKSLRRESSKFGLQLFQIAESVFNSDEDKKPRRQTRPYTRGESTNSYLTDKKIQAEGSTPASTSETPAPDKMIVKRQSVAKLFGARPVPMVRRSSFPALPLNPEVQALMLGHRQASCDSDDEDGRGRRVRIIRRY